MNKIYLVIECSGEYDDYIEMPIKAFRDIKVAQMFVKQLDDQQQGFEDMAKKCQECAGLNKECPFYTMAFDKEDECAAYQPYYDIATYRIDEIDFEE